MLILVCSCLADISFVEQLDLISILYQFQFVTTIVFICNKEVTKFTNSYYICIHIHRLVRPLTPTCACNNSKYLHSYN